MERIGESAVRCILNALRVSRAASLLQLVPSPSATTRMATVHSSLHEESKACLRRAILDAVELRTSEAGADASSSIAAAPAPRQEIGTALEGRALRGLDFAGVRLTASFNRADLSTSCWSGAYITHSTFNLASMRHADVSGARFVACNFVATEAAAVDARGARFAHCVFRRADLRDWDVTGATFYRCSFDLSDLSGWLYDSETSVLEPEGWARCRRLRWRLTPRSMARECNVIADGRLMHVPSLPPPFVSSEGLQDIVEVLRGVYGCMANEERQRFTHRLIQIEGGLSGLQTTQVGLGLLQHTGDGAAVQAYGAVLLRHAICERRLLAENLPFDDLLTWYCTDDALSRLLVGDLMELLVECVLHAQGDLVRRVLAVTCREGSSLCQQTRSLLLTQHLVQNILEPDFARLPRERAGVLRRQLLPHGEWVLRCVTQALFHDFSLSGGAAATTYAPASEPRVEAGLALIALLAPQLPPSVWDAVALADTLAALLRWTPAQRAAVLTTATLLRLGTDAAATGRLQPLLTLVLETTTVCAASRELATLAEVFDLLDELPRPLIQATGLEVYHALLSVLAVPSIQFANQVCALLLRCCDANNNNSSSSSISSGATHAIFATINPLDLYAAIYALVPKNQFHPTLGYHTEGMRWSEEQLGYVALYESTFADFRGSSGKLLELLAPLHPALTNQYVLQLLSSLPDAGGGAQDERTAKGFVTQASRTFRTWEAVQFMVDHLAEAFRYASEHVPECVHALVSRQPRDAVLLPVFFNILSTFWRCRADAALNVWEGTVQILFSCVENRSWDLQDLDEAAARRRAYTLLVQMCSQHAHELGAGLVQSIVARLQPLLLRTVGQDRALLYEALTGLTTAMPANEADSCLRAVVQPILSILHDAVRDVSRQQDFDRMIIGAEAGDRERRDQVRDCLTIVAAVLRRCRMSAYVLEAALQLCEVVLTLVKLLHGLDPAALPAGFGGVLEMEGADRIQCLPGQSRQSNAAELSEACRGAGRFDQVRAVRGARMAVMQIRLAIYQVFGALSPMLPAERLAAALDDLAGVRALPLHAIRALSERCLFPIGEQHPELLVPVIHCLTRFFARRDYSSCSSSNNNHSAAVTPGEEGQSMQQPRQRGSNDGGRGAVNRAAARTRREQDEVIDSKQWLYYTKDVQAYIRRCVLDPARWRAAPALLTAVSELAACMLDSHHDSRGVLRFVLSLVELPVEVATEEVQREQQGIRVVLYAQLVRFVTHADATVLPPSELDSVAYLITEPYIQLIPQLAAALGMVGVAPDRVDMLHAQIALANHHAARRRKLKDFLLQLAREAQQGT